MRTLLLDPFVFRRKINNKVCDLKIDRGSDVTIVNPRLVAIIGKYIRR